MTIMSRDICSFSLEIKAFKAQWERENATLIAFMHFFLQSLNRFQWHVNDLDLTKTKVYFLWVFLSVYLHISTQRSAETLMIDAVASYFSKLFSSIYTSRIVWHVLIVCSFSFSRGEEIDKNWNQLSVVGFFSVLTVESELGAKTHFIRNYWIIILNELKNIQLLFSHRLYLISAWCEWTSSRSRSLILIALT